MNIVLWRFIDVLIRELVFFDANEKPDLQLLFPFSSAFGPALGIFTLHGPPKTWK